jgi:glyoxylase-like metal-dependent hydrolase (beta-lactamase superfamily II)
MLLKETDYNGVKGFEIARTYFGKPIWTTRIYIMGPFMIDTAAPNVSEAVGAMVERFSPQMVLVTHHHEDHSGNAGMIKDRFGLPVLGSRLTALAIQKKFYLAPFQRLIWGSPRPKSMDVPDDEITCGDYTLKMHPAPGHSPDMTVFLEPDRGWLFSGDLYLASRVKVFRDDEDFGQTKASLQKILELDFDALFCAHNPKPQQGKKYLKEKLQYLLELEGNVKDLHRKGSDSREIAARLLGSEGLFPLLTSGRLAKRHLIDSILAQSS